MLQDKCSNADLYKPRYDIERKELIIPISMLHAQWVIEKTPSLEFDKIKNN